MNSNIIENRNQKLSYESNEFNNSDDYLFSTSMPFEYYLSKRESINTNWNNNSQFNKMFLKMFTFCQERASGKILTFGLSLTLFE